MTIELVRLRPPWQRALSPLYALREARPVVIILFSLRFAVGGLLGSAGASFDLYSALLGHVSWLFAIWAIYLVNGVTDIAEDRANNSLRPIAQGLLNRSTAMYLCVGLALAAVQLSLLVGPIFCACVAAVLVLGAAYSLGKNPLKDQGSAALAIAATGGVVTYLSGALAYGGHVSVPVIVFALVASLWMGVGGATKDLGDIPGDRLAGRVTLPVVVGPERAAWLIAVASCGVGVIGLLTFRIDPSLLALVFVLPSAVALTLKLRGQIRRTSRAARRIPYRVFMVSQYVINGLTLMLSAVQRFFPDGRL